MQTLIDMDLHHDQNSLCLTLVILKSMDEMALADLLRAVSYAFAETESVSIDLMHAALESEVQGFETDSHWMFVWHRGFDAKSVAYPRQLDLNLTRLLSSRTSLSRHRYRVPIGDTLISDRTRH